MNKIIVQTIAGFITLMLIWESVFSARRSLTFGSGGFIWAYGRPCVIPITLYLFNTI